MGTRMSFRDTHLEKTYTHKPHKLYKWVCVQDTSFLGGHCSTVQGLLDWFEVDLGFTELLFIQIGLCVLSVCPRHRFRMWFMTLSFVLDSGLRICIYIYVLMCTSEYRYKHIDIDLTHSYVGHDLLKCGAWLIHMWDVTRSQHAPSLPWQSSVYLPHVRVKLHNDWGVSDTHSLAHKHSRAQHMRGAQKSLLTR